LITNFETEFCILGGTGAFPGLYFYDVQSGEACPLAETDIFGAGIYALVFEPDAGRIVGGDREGKIYLYELNSCRTTTVDYGMPILSICCLDQHHLVVADTKRHCEIFSLVDNSRVHVLVTGNETICSLAKSESDLYGLSTLGNLFVWNCQTLQAVAKFKLFVLPKQFALVDLLCMPEVDLLCSPGQNGQLCLMRPSTGETIRFHAHRGEVFALCEWQGKILSIGYNDGRLKLWTFAGCMGDSEFLPGIVKVKAINDDKIIVLDIDGKMSIHRISRSGCQKISSLANGVFRSIISVMNFRLEPSADAVKKEVAELVEKIKDLVDEDRRAEVEVYHDRLVALGFKHISLCLKAETKIASGDNVDAALLYQQVLKIIPAGVSVAIKITHQYAHLLERFWLLGAAVEVYANIKDEIPVVCLHIPDLMQPRLHEWIVDAEGTVLEIVQVAHSLGIKPSGRYLLKRLEEIFLPNIQVEAKDLHGKFQESKKQPDWPQFLQLRLERANIIDNTGNRPQDLIIVPLKPVGVSRFLQLGIMIETAVIGSVLTPIVILNFSHAALDELSETSVYELFNHGVGRSVDMQIAEAMELIQDVLSCVVNDKLSKEDL